MRFLDVLVSCCERLEYPNHVKPTIMREMIQQSNLRDDEKEFALNELSLHLDPGRARMKNPIMRYFEYEHLDEPQRSVSRLHKQLAHVMNRDLPDSAEKSAGLRKLLEAKDCFVRASLPERDT